MFLRFSYIRIPCSRYLPPVLSTSQIKVMLEPKLSRPTFPERSNPSGFRILGVLGESVRKGENLVRFDNFI